MLEFFVGILLFVRILHCPDRIHRWVPNGLPAIHYENGLLLAGCWWPCCVLAGIDDSEGMYKCTRICIV